MSYQRYLNNPHLKRAYVDVHLTQDEVDEYVKCKDDPFYFLQNYYWIKTPGGQEKLFVPRPYQRQMLEEMINNRFVISKWPRQSGKSTIVVAFFLWVVMFHPNRETLILSKTEVDAKGMLARFKFAYEKIPMWMQTGILKWDATLIELENKSSIKVGPTTAAAGRSGSYNIVFLDEFAFVDGNKAQEFYTSVYPTITAPAEPGDEPTKLIIVSTPRGMNLFYDLWIGATEGKTSFIPIEVMWNDIPGRDEDWWQEQIQNLGDEEKVRQEFGGEFMGAENTLISGRVLDRMKKRDIIMPLKSDNGLFIYEYPKPGHRYIICVDPSEGIGQDYSAFQVVDVTEKPYKQAAAFYHNRTDITTLPNIIYVVCKNYNDPYVFVELNNGLGDQVASTLYHDMEYENMCMTTRGLIGRPQKLTLGSSKFQTQLGIKTTNAVKNKGSANLKDVVENDDLIIRDKHTLREFTNFTKQGPSFKAEPGAHDDLVMCLVLFGWLVKDPTFEELAGKKIGRDYDELEELSRLPFVRTDGQDPVIEMDNDGTTWYQSDYKFFH